MQPAETTPSATATVPTPAPTAAQPTVEQPQPALSDAEKREVMIRLAAYTFYERRGLVAGHELEDWLQAEMEVDRQLAAASPPAPDPATAAQPTPAGPPARPH